MAKELNNDQQVVYNHLKLVSDEGNLVDNLFEITESYQSVSDDILDSYEKLSKKQFVEVIYKISEALILS